MPRDLVRQRGCLNGGPIVGTDIDIQPQHAAAAGFGIQGFTCLRRFEVVDHCQHGSGQDH